MTFFNEHEKIDLRSFKPYIFNTDKKIIKKILNGDEIKFREFLYLLSPAAGEFLNEMALLSQKKTKMHFGKNIQLYIPLYLSNECDNSCVYCGFNSTNQIDRKRLNKREIKEELRYIRSLGFKNILLLTGDAPEKVDLNYIIDAVKTAKKEFPQVSLEIYPMETEAYRVLINAGATGLTVYQETYNKKVYLKIHTIGKKRDFKFRLTTPDRAAEAGFRKISIGALLGLDDWRLEAVSLAIHAGYIIKKFWRVELNISFPRIRDSFSKFQPFRKVSDRELAQMIFAFRLYLERVGLTISTRETPSFRDNMIGYGVTMMSAGSKTNPGGYKLYKEHKDQNQFEIEDTRQVNEFVKVIKKKGYYPVFKDWSSDFEGIHIEGSS